MRILGINMRVFVQHYVDRLVRLEATPGDMYGRARRVVEPVSRYACGRAIVNGCRVAWVAVAVNAACDQRLTRGGNLRYGLPAVEERRARRRIHDLVD